MKNIRGLALNVFMFLFRHGYHATPSFVIFYDSPKITTKMIHDFFKVVLF